MTVEIQAGMADEVHPLDVISPLAGKVDSKNPLDPAIPQEDRAEACSEATTITLLVVIQPRDP